VRVVVGLAHDRVVLVHAEAVEVERLAVDEELRAAHLDRADPDRLVHRVADSRAVDELHLEVVQVAGPGRPQVDVRHLELPGLPHAGRHLDAVGVAQHHLHVEPVGVEGLDGPAHGARRPLEARRDGDVLGASAPVCR
jgi:hypothetical protein